MIWFDSNAYASYEQSGLQNVEFTTAPAAQGMVLDAWIESNASNTATNTLYWVKLPYGIGAHSSITIYMNFMPNSVMSSSGPTGEAPQLSPTYAQYDDGANVFDIYFNGDTPTSDFVTGGPCNYCSDGVTQQTGVTLPNGATGNVLRFTTSVSEQPSTVDMFTAKSLQNSPNYYISEASFESDGSINQPTGVSWGLAQKSFSYNSGNATSNDAIFVGTQYNSCYFMQGYISGYNYTPDANSQGSTTTAWRYSSLIYNSSSSFYAYIAPQLYSTSGGYSGKVSTNPIASISPLYWGFWGEAAFHSGQWVQFNWVRVRAYPPNGVMPSPTNIINVTTTTSTSTTIRSTTSTTPTSTIQCGCIFTGCSAQHPEAYPTCSDISCCGAYGCKGTWVSCI
jgi:hypothetical protein